MFDPSNMEMSDLDLLLEMDSDLDLKMQVDLDRNMDQLKDFNEESNAEDLDLDFELQNDIAEEVWDDMILLDRLENEREFEFSDKRKESNRENNTGLLGSKNGSSIHSIGLDNRLVDYYSSKGLTNLYDWQSECITRPGVFEGRNLVYSAPTSGGKTLVSELLMYKRVLETGRGALIVFPFVSLVSEKRDSYYKVGGNICGLKVSEFHHGSNSSLYECYDIGVATIEKANSIINHYIESGDLFKRLSVVVVDELHLLGDEQRGYMLEVMLTKIRLLSKLIEGESSAIQIIGMSATLPNLNDIGNWLDAVVYQSSYRPVPLREHIVLDGKVYLKPDRSRDSSFATNTELKGEGDTKISKLFVGWGVRDLYESYDQEEFNQEDIGLGRWRYPLVNMRDLLMLGWDSLKKGESVLVFCPTKHSVETTALFYARCLRREFFEGINLCDFENTGVLPGSERTELRLTVMNNMEQIRRVRRRMVDEIINLSTGTGKGRKQIENLLECIRCGIGYHHSGLSSAERKIIEKGYRSGALSLLTATSTLAAGVNLPSKRVIFRGINIGKSFLTCVDYKQMSGRAGRVGQKSPYGESFVLVNKEEQQTQPGGVLVTEEDRVKAAFELVTADMLPLMSTFHTNINSLARLILEVLVIIRESTVCTNLVKDGSQTLFKSILDLVIESTLMYHQKRLHSEDEGLVLTESESVSDTDDTYSRNLLKRTMDYLVVNNMVVYRGGVKQSGVTYSEYTTYTLVDNKYLLDYYCTSFGRSIVVSGLSPSAGLDLKRELKASLGSVLINDLTYMAFQVTPIPGAQETVSFGANIDHNNSKGKTAYCSEDSALVSSSSLQVYYRVDWECLFEVVKNMGVVERQSIVKMGFDLDVISLASQRGGGGSLPPRLKGDTNTLRRYQRLYASNIIKLLLSGVSVDEIKTRYRLLGLNDIQQLYTNSLAFCVSCIAFTQCMGYWSLNLAFQSYLKRLQSVALYDEHSNSVIFSKERYFAVNRNIKKLVSNINSLSNISALELKGPPLFIKTLNQFLVVPRRSIIYSLNNRVYSGNTQTLNFVSQCVNYVFENHISKGKKVPYYNKKMSLFNLDSFLNSVGTDINGSASVGTDTETPGHVLGDCGVPQSEFVEDKLLFTILSEVQNTASGEVQDSGTVELGEGGGKDSCPFQFANSSETKGEQR